MAPLPRGLWCLAFALMAIATSATSQQPAQRRESAGVAVRYREGTVHGFLELRTAAGALLANGDLLQVPGDSGVESRLVFHFPDSSLFEETVRFTQHGVFALQQYHLVQRGPAFANDLEVTLSRSGQYVVTTKAHKDGHEKRYAGKLDLPADVYNGMVITIAKNMTARDTQEVHLVAFTPQPRLIGLEIAPDGTQQVMLGQHGEAAVHFKLKPKLGAVLKVFATLEGKAPPDSDIWIVAADVPAFVGFQGPLYAGPVWRMNLTSPSWPR